MTEQNTKTIKRQVIIRDIDVDFGLGPGVLYQDEAVYGDKNGAGFDSPEFKAVVEHHALQMVNSIIEVRLEEATTLLETDEAFIPV